MEEALAALINVVSFGLGAFIVFLILKVVSTVFEEEDDRVLGTTTKSRWRYSCTKPPTEATSLMPKAESRA